MQVPPGSRGQGALRSGVQDIQHISGFSHLGAEEVSGDAAAQRVYEQMVAQVKSPPPLDWMRFQPRGRVVALV